MKQIIQTKHNQVKNPSWQEANQLAILHVQAWPRICTWDFSGEQDHLAVRTGIELEAFGLQHLWGAFDLQA